MSSAGIRRTGQGVEQRGKQWRGWGGQVPEFWPQSTAASQRAGGRQLGRQVGRGEEEGTEKEDRGGRR